VSDLFLDRVPPQNKEAEQSVLGAVFLSKEALITAIEILRPEDFYKTAHQRIFQTMVDLYEKGEPVDLVTVTAELQDHKLLDEVGGVTYITEIASSVPTAANIEYYAKIVEEKSLLRRLIHTATKIANDGYSREDDVTEIIADAEKYIMEIGQNRNSGGFQPIRDVLLETYERIEILSQRRGDITGIPSGYTDLDKMTAGFQRSDLIILAARPSVGKTAFALNVAQNVAARANETVAIFPWRWGRPSLFSV